MSNQETAAKPPEGIKAGHGKFYFELATVNHIDAGPAYSTARGPLWKVSESSADSCICPKAPVPATQPSQ